MNGLLINGSPKRSGSASAVLLNDLKSLLDREIETTVLNVNAAHPAATAGFSGIHWEPSPAEERLFSCADFLVFAFPLYVDSVPSHFLSFLTELERQIQTKGFVSDTRPPAVYAAVNCGFYEGRQAVPALRIVENWCARCGLDYKQGIGCGAGGMLASLAAVPPLAGPKKPLGLALTDMAGHIGELKAGGEHLLSLKFPRPLYITAAHYGWRKQGRENGLKAGELKSRK